MTVTDEELLGDPEPTPARRPGATRPATEVSSARTEGDPTATDPPETVPPEDAVAEPREPRKLSDYGMTTMPLRAAGSKLPLSHDEYVRNAAAARERKIDEDNPAPGLHCDGELHYRGWPHEDGPTEWIGSRTHRSVFCTACTPDALDQPLFAYTLDVLPGKPAATQSSDDFW